MFILLHPLFPDSEHCTTSHQDTYHYPSPTTTGIYLCIIFDATGFHLDIDSMKDKMLVLRKWQRVSFRGWRGMAGAIPWSSFAIPCHPLKCWEKLRQFAFVHALSVLLKLQKGET